MSEAINEIEHVNGEFDLAIIGMDCPIVKEGFWLASLLAVNPRLAIAVVSDANASDLRRRFAKANRIDFLQKPYSKDRLRTLTLRYCST